MSIHDRICAICLRDVSSSAPYSFCDEHLRQFLARQQEEVTTEALDSRWGDTLNIWRERPPILEKEIIEGLFASPFIFSLREKDWVVFARFYFTQKSDLLRPKKNNASQKRTPRLQDTLAVNVCTGEIRRFVSLPREIVLEDLRGERSAPYQDELAPFWGNPDLGDIQKQWEQQFYDKYGSFDISKLVAQIETPVYGITNHHAEFLFESLFTCGFSNYRVNYIGFLFSSSQKVGEQQRKFHLISGTSHYPAGEGLKFLDTVSGYNDYEHLLLFYHLEKEDQGQINFPSVWEGELSIAQQTFSGEIRYWSQPYKVSSFSLREKGTDTSLEGSASGLSFEELLQVFSKLEVVNQREDVLLQYQNERQD